MKHLRVRFLVLLTVLAPGLSANCIDTACVEAGPGLLAVDGTRSTLFNAVTGQLLGEPVSLTPAEWEALSQTRLSVADVTGELRAVSGDLSDAEILASQFTLREFTSAAAAAARAQGDATAAAALEALPVDSLGGTTSLDQLLGGTGVDGTVSAMNLANGLISLNSLLGAGGPVAPTILSGDSLGLAGLVDSVEFSAMVEDAPYFTCGPAGTEFRTAGLRLKLGLNLPAVDLSEEFGSALATEGVALPAGSGQPTATLTRLNLYVVVGRTDGFISAIDATAGTVNLRARPGTVDLYLGEIDDVTFFDRSSRIRATDVGFAEIGTIELDAFGTPVAASVQVRSAVSGAPAGYESLFYVGPYPETQTLAADPFLVDRLLSSLLADLELQVVAEDGAGLDPLLQPAVDEGLSRLSPAATAVYGDALSPVVRTVVDTTVNSTLALSGTRLGETDLTVTGVHLDCGPGPHARFTPDNEGNASPGSVVFYSHLFTADAAGEVTFSGTHDSDPALAGWDHVLYRDTNADGRIDPGEPVLAGPVRLAAGERLHLVARVATPAAAPYGARDVLTVRAEFILAGVPGAPPSTYTRTDTTVVGDAAALGLVLAKEVDRESARPGDSLTYTISYRNQGATSFRNLVITDQTPAYTDFVSAATSGLPAELSAVEVTTPAAGGSGALRWTFSGELAPGASGSVSFVVRVQE